MRHESTDLDDAIAFRIHRTNRLLRTHLARILEEYEPGLSPEQYFVMVRVAHLGPVRQVALSEPVLGDPPNVSRLVDALVARGYLERSPDPADRRSFLVSLTERGRRFSDRILQLMVDQRRRLFDGFDEAELDALAEALDRIDANVRRLLTDPISPRT